MNHKIFSLAGAASVALLAAQTLAAAVTVLTVRGYQPLRRRLILRIR